MSVEQLVSLVVAGLTQILIIKLLDIGILVALAELEALILGVNSLGALGGNVHVHLHSGGNDGLTAAGYAATGAGHDLNEINLSLAGANAVEKLAGVAQTVSNGGTDSLVANLNGGDLHALKTADGLVVNVLDRLTGEDVSHGTEGSLHNAAGSAEDNAGAGGLVAEGRVKDLIGQLGKLNTALLYHGW